MSTEELSNLCAGSAFQELQVGFALRPLFVVPCSACPSGFLVRLSVSQLLNRLFRLHTFADKSSISGGTMSEAEFSSHRWVLPLG